MSEASMVATHHDRPRRRWIAGLLSLVTPGLGQVYAGDLRRGLIALALSMTGILTAFDVLLGFRTAPANIVIFLSLSAGLTLLILTDAVRLAGRNSGRYQLQRFNRWYIYLLVYLAGTLVASVILQRMHDRTEAFRIPTTSMEPTVLRGDYLMVDKGPSAVADSRRDQVVVFASVEEPGLKVMKRIAGLPGDTLEMRAGVLWRNGHALAEPWSLQGIPPRSEEAKSRAIMRNWQLTHLVGPVPGDYQPDLGNWGPIVVSVDSCFMLGDNRDNSYDSRYYGLVPLPNILGRPLVVYFSVDRGSDGSFGAVRWSRFGLRFD